MKYMQEEVASARRYLFSVLPPSTTVYTKLNHVSRSGMLRSISLYTISNNELIWLTGYSAPVLGERLDRYDGISIVGCGMDMGFELVYRLGRALYPDGFGVEGKGPLGKAFRPKTREAAAKLVAEGHRFYGRNGDPSGWDSDGGYALKQKWL